MGLFPIAMNILQFWLIDSIVKASTPAELTLGTYPSVSQYPDREPLFNAGSDDEDEDDYSLHDIENQRGNHFPDTPPPAGDKSNIPLPKRDEHRSTGGTPSQSGGSHSYPPNLSSTTTSTSSSSSQDSGPPRPARNLLKNAKRRPAPAPLNIRTLHQPVVNSPGVMAVPSHAPYNTTEIPLIAPEPEANETWAGWEEPGEWAGQRELDKPEG